MLSLPTGTEMFQFPALASCPYGFRAGSLGISQEGLPHSGIPGLASVCDYPGLIAAYHALHRLLVPRHPPYTLSSLTPLCFGETEWIPDRYSVVKEQLLAAGEEIAPARLFRAMVEMSGIEPLTPCLQSRCSPV